MPHAFLEGLKDRPLVTGLDIDHPRRREPGLGDSRGEQVRSGEAPQDLAVCPRHHTGGEQSGGCRVNGAVPATGHLMQGAHGKSPSRKMAVHNLDAERQHRALAERPAFQALDPVTELSNDGMIDVVHFPVRGSASGFTTAPAGVMFSICSLRTTKESIAAVVPQMTSMRA